MGLQVSPPPLALSGAVPARRGVGLAARLGARVLAVQGVRVTVGVAHTGRIYLAL